MLCANATEITVLIRTQDCRHDHDTFAQLRDQAVAAGWPAHSVISMVDVERSSKHDGLWSYKPWLFQLRHGEKKVTLEGQRWFVFLEPATAVNFEKLRSVLGEYDARGEVLVGRKLMDERASIIHHYSTDQAYLQALSGFALSGALVNSLAGELVSKPLGGNQQIEPVWELVKWIEESRGVAVTDRSDVFCGDEVDRCATWVAHRPRAHMHLSADQVVIGVKTVGKFHDSRIPMVRDFWAQASEVEVLFLSNEPFHGDSGGRVVDLSPEFGELVDPAKESTKDGSGHCSKMYAIVQYLSRHVSGRQWYVVVDDDTLLNVPRLLEVLSSHDSSQALYIGERYGWAHREQSPGTNYVTTGGGMALSGPALQRLAACQRCTCRRPDAPDDMTLGAWTSSLGIPIIHEPAFHQSEPHNYHPEVLRLSERPVSFHRFGVHLPANAPEQERQAARRSNWRRWVDNYFVAEPQHADSEMEEL